MGTVHPQGCTPLDSTVSLQYQSVLRIRALLSPKRRHEACRACFIPLRARRGAPRSAASRVHWPLLGKRLRREPSRLHEEILPLCSVAAHGSGPPQGVHLQRWLVGSELYNIVSAQIKTIQASE